MSPLVVELRREPSTPPLGRAKERLEKPPFRWERDGAKRRASRDSSDCGAANPYIPCCPKKSTR